MDEFMNRTELRVRYQETDQMGFVYYANYLIWFEVGRNELFRELEIPYTLLEQKGVYIPVTKADCEYKYPARYDDIVVVYTKINNLTPARTRCEYVINRKDENKETLLAVGFTDHAFVNENGRPVSLAKKCPDIYHKLQIETD